MSKPRRKSSGFSNTPKTKSQKINSANRRSADHTHKEYQAVELIKQGKPQEAESIYRDLISSGTTNYIVYGNLAAILGMQGRFDELIDLLRKTIELEPSYPDAHNNLGNALKRQGDLTAAIASYNTALQLQPNYPDAHYNLGNALQEQGDLSAAIASYKTALQLQPNYPVAHNNLGVALQEQGDLKAAIASYNTALQLQPDYSGAYYNLGNTLQEQGDISAAIDSYQKAVELDPENSDLFYAIGRAQQKQGDIEKGILSFNRAIELNPKNTAAFFRLSKTINTSKEAAELAEDLDKLKKEELSNREDSYLEFALANCFHKSHDYTKAAQHLANANRQKLLYLNSDLALQLKESTRILSLSKQIQLGEPCDGTGRIFIIGAPRCGSTLLESVLATNRNIKDLGESKALAQAFAETKPMSGTEKKGSELAKAYTKASKEALTEFTHSIDKNLYNFRFVEAIKRSMPAAKIIHCHRNPLDNILSMLRSNLRSGNNYTASALESAKFLIHQEEVLSPLKQNHKDQIFTFNYDEFTNKPETQAKELIEWIGLHWNDNYLHPEQNKRIISTASVIQARQPITNKSVGGWKNYKDLLRPAEVILRESGLFNI